MTADRSAGKPIGEVFPQYGFGSQFARSLPDLVKVAEVEDWSKYDLIFCCLPHATTQEIISGIPLEKTKVVDLSADFRLSNIDTYTAWYGEHKAPNLQKEAVYGLVEHKRDEVRDARLVANPGCYPTAAQLALIPLLKNKSISSSDIIIDAKSGATGAGRSAKVGTLFCEVSDGMHAYGIAQHRHAPEIEQGLSEVTGEDVLVNFTPHLIPMNRGILETIFVKTSESPGALRQQLVEVCRGLVPLHTSGSTFVRFWEMSKKACMPAFKHRRTRTNRSFTFFRKVYPRTRDTFVAPTIVS
mmetsp:Transcript_21003/g.85680  ORF Transcript_21003/g.85680 Transcript_21003/m.85680 type:complete len:299 (+) Transcript_21003:673-1569(+)